MRKFSVDEVANAYMELQGLAVRRGGSVRAKVRLYPAAPQRTGTQGVAERRVSRFGTYTGFKSYFSRYANKQVRGAFP